MSLRLISVLFLVIVAIAVAEAAQVVGVLLVFALMVGPAAAALRLTSRVGWGVGLAVRSCARGDLARYRARLLHRLADELLDRAAELLRRTFSQCCTAPARRRRKQRDEEPVETDPSAKRSPWPAHPVEQTIGIVLENRELAFEDDGLEAVANRFPGADLDHGVRACRQAERTMRRHRRNQEVLSACRRGPSAG